MNTKFFLQASSTEIFKAFEEIKIYDLMQS